MSIEIHNLHFSYGKTKILQEVSLHIGLSETLSILGPNGAGKTTLLNIVAGLLPTPGCDIHYDEKPKRQYTLRQMAQLVAYVPQITEAAFDYSVLDYVVTGCAPLLGTFQRPMAKHYDIALQAIQEMGIEHLIKKSYKQISGGERQQTAIARALAQGSAYILMDEPTSHLDYGNQLRVLRMIRRFAEKGLGIVLTTHNPDHVLLLGGRAAILDNAGRLTTGDSNTLINERLLTGIYNAPLCVTTLDPFERKICFAPSLKEGQL